MRVLGIEIKSAKEYKRIKNDAKKYQRLYEAADKGRRSKAFRYVRNTGVNAEIATALPDLRSRSRNMVRNDSWARRAVEAVVRGTIGEGLRPAPIGNKIENKKIKQIWRNWAETTQCDFYNKCNIYGLQEMLMRAVVEGGDAIVILRRHVPNNEDELPIKLQLCEGDLIDHTQNGINEMGVARLGVQYSKDGELLGYFLYNQHPGDIGFYAQGLKASEFHSKDDILHVFELLRIGQARGVPFGVSGFTRLSQFSSYEDAQLLKQNVAACFSAFIQKPYNPNLDIVPEDEDGLEGTISARDPLDNLEPGIIERLSMDETVTFANPPTVGEYDEYSTRILQGVAASYGITYEMLTMDFSRVNFTSGRLAAQTVSNNFKSWQYNMIVPQFCSPVWDWFMDACLMSGLVSKYIQADWTAGKIQMIDPVKENNARMISVQGGWQTLSEIIREDGREPDEFFEEYKQDMDRLAALGLTVDSIMPAPQVIQTDENNTEQLTNNDRLYKNKVIGFKSSYNEQEETK